MFVKSAPGLEKALRELETIEAEMVPHMRLRTSAARYNTDLVDALDVQDMLQVAEMVIHAALARKESRGPHYREDFPFTDNKNWLKYVVVSREDQTVRTRLEPGQAEIRAPRARGAGLFRQPLRLSQCAPTTRSPSESSDSIRPATSGRVTTSTTSPTRST